jgi:hypothetical protein
VGFEPETHKAGFILSPRKRSIPEPVKAAVDPKVKVLFTLNGETVTSEVMNGL